MARHLRPLRGSRSEVSNRMDLRSTSWGLPGEAFVRPGSMCPRRCCRVLGKQEWALRRFLERQSPSMRARWRSYIRAVARSILRNLPRRPMRQSRQGSFSRRTSRRSTRWPRRRTRQRRKMRKGWSAALLVAAVAGAGAAAHESSPAIHITTLSSRPYLISGGDVLVRIELPGDAAIADTRVKLNGKDVTNAFSAEGGSHGLIGLVSGLRPGENGLAVNSGDSRGRNATVKIVLTNYPITGPIIAGPQQQPFVCTTAQFKLYATLFGGEPMDGAILGPPTDAQCSAPTKITYLYMPVGS